MMINELKSIKYETIHSKEIIVSIESMTTKTEKDDDEDETWKWS